MSTEEWVFHEAEGPRGLAVGLDLAYVYIYAGGGSFLCLGDALGLPCEVGVHAISLPDQVLDAVKAWWQARRHPSPWTLAEPFGRCSCAGRYGRQPRGDL